MIITIDFDRCKLTFEYEGETYTTYGDDVKAKTAERLASLWMLYILSSKELVRDPFFIAHNKTSMPCFIAHCSEKVRRHTVI